MTWRQAEEIVRSFINDLVEQGKIEELMEQNYCCCENPDLIFENGNIHLCKQCQLQRI